MFVHRVLTFPHKAILTGGMLEEIYRYPREFMRLMFDGYGNGIICGLDYSLRGGELFLSAGIFFAGGNFYILSRDVNISDLSAEKNLVVDREYFVALERKTFAEEQCITTTTLELVFNEIKPPHTLGQFVFLGRENFYLPQFTDDPNEMFSRSVLNLCEVPFAARGTSTFHPLLFRQVKNFLQNKPNKTPRDFAILTYLQNNEVISVTTMADYMLAANCEFDVDNRTDFFRAFLTCLREQKSDSGQPQEIWAVGDNYSAALKTKGKLI